MLRSGVPADGIDYLPTGAEYARAGQDRSARRGLGGAGRAATTATTDPRSKGPVSQTGTAGLQRDVAVLAAHRRGMRDRIQDGLPRLVGLDDLVDDTQGHRSGQ